MQSYLNTPSCLSSSALPLCMFCSFDSNSLGYLSFPVRSSHRVRKFRGKHVIESRQPVPLWIAMAATLGRAVLAWRVPVLWIKAPHPCSGVLSPSPCPSLYVAVMPFVSVPAEWTRGLHVLTARRHPPGGPAST